MYAEGRLIAVEKDSEVRFFVDTGKHRVPLRVTYGRQLRVVTALLNGNVEVWGAWEPGGFIGVQSIQEGR